MPPRTIGPSTTSPPLAASSTWIPMEIIIKNKALTDVLEEIIQAYYDVCPTEAQIFEDMVRAESQHLVKQSGMSEDGCFMTLIKLPSNALYRFIKEQVDRKSTRLNSSHIPLSRM